MSFLESEGPTSMDIYFILFYLLTFLFMCFVFSALLVKMVLFINALQSVR